MLLDSDGPNMSLKFEQMGGNPTKLDVVLPEGGGVFVGPQRLRNRVESTARVVAVAETERSRLAKS